MLSLEEKFQNLGADFAPGQEVRQTGTTLVDLMIGEALQGEPVDFSHGDVDAHLPTPGSQTLWNEAFETGGSQAYTEYRGLAAIRSDLASRLASFSGAPVDAENELIITPGTQGALFLAMGAVVGQGTKVAIMAPDYFANRKLVTFLGGTVFPVTLKYEEGCADKGPELGELEEAFQNGAEVFIFSNPNNPTGLVYSAQAIEAICDLARRYNVTVIVDQLYSRLLYAGETYTHLRAQPEPPENLVTIMGPSKTESLSGFRLGVAFGSRHLIERMEKLQAIVSLRAAGYNQAVLRSWFAEPPGWMEDRIAQHQAIRDTLLGVFRGAGLSVSTPQAGSYLFVDLPRLQVSPEEFVGILRLQAAVTVTPGSEFASHTRNSIRLNYSQDIDAARAAAERICEMVERYRDS